MTVAAAFPFVRVRIDTSQLQPVKQRAPGVLAVVGTTPDGADGGSAAVGVPVLVATADDAAQSFSKVTNGVPAGNPLHDALVLALNQATPPSTLYGVRVTGDAVASALAGLEALDDVTLVALAGVSTVGAAAHDNDPATGLVALKAHVEAMTAASQKRIGVAAVDPTREKGPSYVDDVLAAVEPLRSSVSRMIVVAARGATGDVAVAAAATIAGLAPEVSLVLKQIGGLSVPVAAQFTPSEIRRLSEGGVIPLITSNLMSGSALRFAEGRTFTTDDSLLFVDTVRLLDQLDAMLRYGLIGSVGDSRITRGGLTLLKARVEGILGPLVRNGVVDDFSVSIPVLDVLSVPRTSWSPTDESIVTTARLNRQIEAFLTVRLGPAVQQIQLTVIPTA